MVAHNGLCLVHRAEIMQLQGAWGDALEEARRAAERFTGGVLNQLACGKALYRQGEVHRLRGEFGAAEEAYREASRCGCEPQPGLALLRLAQGKARRCGGRDPPGGGRDDASRCSAPRCCPRTSRSCWRSATSRPRAAPVDELEEIAAAAQASDALGAMAAHARGAVALAEGDARGGAGRAAPRRWRSWQELGAPYEAARARVLVGLACRGARRRGHGRAGAGGRPRRLRAAAARAGPRAGRRAGPERRAADAHGLTARELRGAAPGRRRAGATARSPRRW